MNAEVGLSAAGFKLYHQSAMAGLNRVTNFTSLEGFISSMAPNRPCEQLVNSSASRQKDLSTSHLYIQFDPLP